VVKGSKLVVKGMQTVAEKGNPQLGCLHLQTQAALYDPDREHHYFKQNRMLVAQRMAMVRSLCCTSAQLRAAVICHLSRGLTCGAEHCCPCSAGMASLLGTVY